MSMFAVFYHSCLQHLLVWLGLYFSFHLRGKLKTLFQVNIVTFLEEKGLFIIWGFCFALTSELKKVKQSSDN